jgi:protein phosphatase PTC2/3
MRVLPGRLSVSRSFGDCMAKMEKYGGNSNCLIADPDIKVCAITEDTDLLLIGCDGIFD